MQTLSQAEERSRARRTRTDDEEDGAHRAQQQYTWLAYSPKILMNLAPAVRSMFPAIICWQACCGQECGHPDERPTQRCLNEQGAEAAAAGP